MTDSPTARLEAPRPPALAAAVGALLAVANASAGLCVLRVGVEFAGHDLEPGRPGACIGLGRSVALYTTVHPLHTIFTKIFGASISETAMRPDPRPAPTPAAG